MSQAVQSGRSGRLSASTVRSSAHIITGSHSSVGHRPAVLHHVENSFRTEPEVPFPCLETRNIIQELLQAELHDKQYNVHENNRIVMDLANKIKQKIKGLGLYRYRIVTYVAIGQNEPSTINIASRCVWNKDFDQFVDASYTNKSLYAVGLVYAIYQE